MSIGTFDPRVLAALAGTCFAFWPFIQGRSGIGGGTATTVMAVVTIAAMTPLALKQGTGEVLMYGWGLLVVAGIIQTAGILAMVTLAGSVTPKELPRLLVFGFIVQACVPAVIQAFVGGMTMWRAVGFASAAFATYCLASE